MLLRMDARILFPKLLPPIIDLSKGGENMGLLPKFIDDAAGPPAQAVGNTLSNLWDLGIGSHVQLWIKKQEVRQQQNYQDYINRVEMKTQEIPEEFIQEPSLHIVGPAIEYAKYYIESEELREMFANLIASSIDSRKSDKTHPSFVEIIKQLSPLDANNLSIFKTEKSLAIGNYRLNYPDKSGGIDLQTNVFLSNFSQINIELQATSISNLSRVGLINLDYATNFINKDYYDGFDKTELFLSYKNLLSRDPANIPSNLRVYSDITVKHGISKLTPLGEDFVNIVLN